MSIRLLARDIYHYQKEVERLQAALEAAPLKKRVAIEDELRKARAQLRQLQGALDGQIGR